MRRRTWVLVYAVAVIAGVGLFPQVVDVPTAATSEVAP